MACTYSFELNGTKFEFETMSELKEFVSDNKASLRLALTGKEVRYSKLKGTEVLSRLRESQADVRFDDSPIDEFGNRNHDYYIKGVKANHSVTSLIKDHDAESLRLNGHVVFSEVYIEDNYKKNFINKKLKEGLNQKQAELELEEILKKNKLSPEIGTEIHKIAEDFFKGKSTSKLSYVTPEQKNTWLAQLKEIKEKIEKDNPGAEFLPEFIVYDQSMKLAGMIDLLVVMPDGSLRIYDYKTSRKSIQDWSKAKYKSYYAQQAVYKRMLENMGFTVEGTNLITVDLEINDKLEGINQYYLQNINLEVSGIKSKVDSLIPRNTAIAEETIKSNEVDRILEELYGESPRRGPSAKKVSNYAKAKGITETEAVEALSRFYDLSQVTSNIANNIKKDMIPGVSSEKNVLIQSLLKVYKGSHWEVVTNETLSNLGLILMVNTNTDTFDIISINQMADFLTFSAKNNYGFGTNVLGKYIKDQDQHKFGLLDGTVGNVDLMKVMLFLNENPNIADGKKLSGIYSFSSNQGLFTQDVSILMNNAKTIIQKIGGTNNLDKVDVISNVDYLLSYISKIQGDVSYIHKNRIIPTDKENIKEFLNSYQEAVSKYQSTDSKETEYIERILGRAIVEANNLVYVNSDEFSFDDNWTTNLTSIKNPVVRTAVMVMRSAIDEYRENTRKFVEKNRKITEDFLSYKMGLNKGIIGNNVVAFKDILEMKDGKATMRIKDPSTLIGKEKAFAEMFIKEIAVFRKMYGIDTTDSNRLDIPIFRISRDSRLGKGQFKKFFEDYMNNFRNFENLTAEQKLQFTDDVEMYNAFLTYENSESRAKALSKDNPIDEYETDLSMILNYMAMGSYKKQAYDKKLPIYLALESLNRIQELDLTEASSKKNKAIREFLRDVRSSIIFNKPIGRVIEMTDRQMAATTIMLDVVAVNALGFNLMSAAKEAIAGMWNNMLVMHRQSAQNILDKTSFAKAMGMVLADATKDKMSYDSAFMMSEINRMYNVSGVDTNKMLSEMGSNNKGVLNFKSNLLFWLHSAPDYVNRMSIFVGAMIKDGSIDAYTIEDGRLVYDVMKDRRFKEYLSGNTKHPEYNKQKGLYLAVLEQHKTEGKTIIEKNGLELITQGYTTQETIGLKTFSDMAVGSYTRENQAAASRIAGINIGTQFKNWMFMKKDIWYKEGRVTTMGKWVHFKDIEGNLLYRDKDGNNTIEDTGVPLMYWEGEYAEGIVQTILAVGRIAKDENVVAAINYVLENDHVKANAKYALADLALLGFIQLLFGAIFDLDDLDEDEEFKRKLGIIMYRSVNDLNPLKTAKDSISIPVIGTAYDLFTGLWSVAVGDDNPLILARQNALLRSFIPEDRETRNFLHTGWREMVR